MSEQKASEQKAAENPEAVKDQDPEAPPKVDESRAALEAEVAELKAKLLRALAETENIRRRSERDVADARQYAVASFAREMLTVGDNLSRAIEAVPPDARAADPALSNLLEGVEATQRGLAQTLVKFGITEVEAAGKKFDPTFHQAMFEVEHDTLAPGMVAQVVQPGFRIGERVLRPAFVGVSKGKPKPAAANDGGPESGAKDAESPANAGD